jgi:hypothetical protein
MTTAATQIERPRTVYAEYWPASVLMPDGTVRHRVRVYLTDTGAHLFFTKPMDELAPGFTAPIDFAATTPPNIHAHNIGVDIMLAPPDDLADAYGDGARPLLVVTPGGGCGCGSTLKSWRPTWAHAVSPWPGQ